MTKNKTKVTAKSEAELELPLTAKELEAVADKAASLMKKLDKEEEDFKLLKRVRNAEIKQLKQDIRDFLADYNNKTTLRKVECVQHFDLKTKRTWYEYKGKRYDERDLDDYEMAKARQKGLFDDGPDLPGVTGGEKDAAATKKKQASKKTTTKAAPKDKPEGDPLENNPPPAKAASPGMTAVPGGKSQIQGPF